ncbi:hypothetical protein Vretifemale_9267 [Volvox reticuliferus]|uniref:Uncharacterized protein n=1 Tax=Volvox reticuliferus TaxID=1737510 RepID=A0A8J4FP15_9CHLO|nr:hypothetical protein Vretifemale_9267 [Volvox reticuliferus]
MLCLTGSGTRSPWRLRHAALMPGLQIVANEQQQKYKPQESSLDSTSAAVAVVVMVAVLLGPDVTGTREGAGTGGGSVTAHIDVLHSMRGMYGTQNRGAEINFSSRCRCCCCCCERTLPSTTPEGSTELGLSGVWMCAAGDLYCSHHLIVGW